MDRDMGMKHWIQTTGAVIGVAALLAGGLTATATAATSRVAGGDRYGTAAAVSGRFAVPGGSVFVASGEGFADALAGGAVAAAQGAPVLLVKKDSVPESIASELARLAPQRITVLGGQAVVSDAVLKTLEASAPVTVRAGDDRYGTAAALSAASYPQGVDTAFLASGENYPDALAGGVAAGGDAAPVLLARKGSLPDATAAELRRLAPQRIVVLGGAAAISDDVFAQVSTIATAERVAGSDRFATSTQLSARAFAKARTVYLANGLNYPDALSGAPLAAAGPGPILLVSPAPEKNRPVCAEIARLGAEDFIVLGGTSAVADAIVKNIEEGCPRPGEHFFRGSGDSVITLPQLQASLISFSHDGPSNFIVWSLDGSGSQIDLLVNEIGAYRGTNVLNFGEPVASALTVKAGGAWTVTVAPLSSAPVWNLSGTLTGRGDSVVGTPGGRSGLNQVTIRHQGRSNFVIWARDAEGRPVDLMVNEIGPYTGTVLLPNNAAYLIVTADGEWSIARA